jgi:hypothetical protein
LVAISTSTSRTPLRLAHEATKLFAQQRGLTLVPVTVGALAWENSKRRLWHPHWKRVEEGDLELGICPWASRRRKQVWLARFGVAIPKSNTRMVSLSQHIAD